VGAAGGGAGGTVEVLNGMFVRGYAEVVTPPKRAYSKEILEHVRQACVKSKRSGRVTAALVVWRLSSGLDPRFLKADGSPLYTVEECPDEDDIDEMNAKFYTRGELGGRGRKKDGVAAAASGAAAGHGDEGDALSGGSAAAAPRLPSRRRRRRGTEAAAAAGGGGADASGGGSGGDGDDGAAAAAPRKRPRAAAVTAGAATGAAAAGAAATRGGGDDGALWERFAPVLVPTGCSFVCKLVERARIDQNS
jgi:hypothetical protein